MYKRILQNVKIASYGERSDVKTQARSFSHRVSSHHQISKTEIVEGGHLTPRNASRESLDKKNECTSLARFCDHNAKVTEGNYQMLVLI